MATQASASKWRKASRRITETLVLFQIMVAIRKPTTTDQANLVSKQNPKEGPPTAPHKRLT